MKILSCYIAHFGKIEDFSYEFKDGLNSIFKDNGWGKTTFSVFIKAMFYGMEYSPNTKKKLLERNHFLPWDGSVCGGNIVFSIDEATYKVERTFGKTDKDDTFKIYDATTGLETNDFSSNLGEELFLVDRDSFEKSIYVPQLGISTGMTDSLNAKMGNLSSAQADINNFDVAVKKVTNARSEYTRSSKVNPGKLNKVKSELSLLREDYETLPAITEAYKANLQMLEDKRKRLEILQKQKDELVERIQFQSKREQDLGAYRLHKENLAKELEKKQEYDTYFVAGIPDENKLIGLEKIEHELSVHEASLENMYLDGKNANGVYMKPFKEKVPTEQEFLEWNEKSAKLSKLRAKAEQAKLSDEAISNLEDLKYFFKRYVPQAEELSNIEKKATQITELDGRISQADERLRTVRAEKTSQERRMMSEKNYLGRTIAIVIFLVAVIGGIMFHLYAQTSLGMIIEIACYSLAVVDVILLILLSRKKKLADDRANEVAIDVERKAEEELAGFVSQRQALEEDCSKFLSNFLLTRAETMQENVYEVRRKLDQYNHLLEEENSIQKNAEGTLDELADLQLELYTQIQSYATAYGINLFDTGNEFAFLTQLRADADKYVKYMLLEQEMAAQENYIRDLKSKLNKILGAYPIDEKLSHTQQVKELRIESQKYVEILNRIEELQHEIDVFEQVNNVNEAVESVDELQEQQKELDEQIVELNKQIIQTNENLSKNIDEMDRLNDLSEQIERLELQEKEYKVYADLLGDTVDLLQKARTSFLAKYMQPLQAGLHKYMGLLNENNEHAQECAVESFELDMELGIKMNYKGSMKSSDYLSAGYQDMAAFCSRLALIDVLYTQEQPLLILDDPFMNLDQNKITEAMHLLDELAKERQIIYFTCHESRL